MRYDYKHEHFIALKLSFPFACCDVSEVNRELRTCIKCHLSSFYLEKVCDFMEFPNDNLKSEQYIHGDVFSFLRRGSTDLNFKLYRAGGGHKYTISFSDEVKLSGSGNPTAETAQIPGVNLDPHWIPFWVDMRKTGRITVGTGATVLLNFTDVSEQLLPFLNFFVSAAGEQIIYCDKKGM